MQSVHQVALPQSDQPLLICPSGGLAVGVSGRRWLVVMHDGHAAVYAPGAEAGIETELNIGLTENDAPWRLSNGITQEIGTQTLHWALTTRDGSIFEIYRYADEMHVRVLCGPARPLASAESAQWGSWITSLFSSQGEDEASSRRFMACCCIPGNQWLVVDEDNMLCAFAMFPPPNGRDGMMWQSDVLAGEDRSPVVDMLYNFRSEQLFVVREKESAIEVYVFEHENDRHFVQANRIGLSSAVSLLNKLSLSDQGSVVVVRAQQEPSTASTTAAALSAFNNDESSMSASFLSTTNDAMSELSKVPIEKVQQLSNELVGAYAGDLWLAWAEKVNNVSFDKISQVLRSRVVKHRALLAANPENRLLQENNAALVATYGLFSGGWNEMVHSEEGEDAVIKNAICSVISASIGPSNARRLAARNLHVFSMLWSCCPVITHVLDLLKQFASTQHPYRTRYWAFRLLSGGTIPLSLLEGRSGASLIKPSVLLAFLDMPNLNSYGFESATLAQLSIATVMGAGGTKVQKVKALQLLELYGPPDVYRANCLEQGLRLVQIAVQDHKAGSREALYDFLQNRAGFEEELWETLVFGGEETLDVALSVADDKGGPLSVSLFAFLDTRPHAGVLALHSVQSVRFDKAAQSLSAQAAKEDTLLRRKKTLASLAFLSAKCVAEPTTQDALEREALIQVRTCRSAAMCGISGLIESERLTAESVFNFCLTKLEKGDNSEMSLPVYGACALEVASSDQEKAAAVVLAAYQQDTWEEIANTAAASQGLVKMTVLGKIFPSILTLPSLEFFQKSLHVVAKAGTVETVFHMLARSLE